MLTLCDSEVQNMKVISITSLTKRFQASLTLLFIFDHYVMDIYVMLQDSRSFVTVDLKS